MTAVREKKLAGRYRIKLTERVSTSVNGGPKSLSISCWCGQSVWGEEAIVEEAHRQHLMHHEVKP